MGTMLEVRSSIGVERDPDLAAAFEDRIDGTPELSRELAGYRLRRHREFVGERDEEPGYGSEHYDTGDVTGAERWIQLLTVVDVARDSTEPLRFVASHETY